MYMTIVQHVQYILTRDTDKYKHLGIALMTCFNLDRILKLT
mgnify:CR=1 FL=1